MRTISEQSEEFERLAGEVKNLGGALAAALPVKEGGYLLPRDTNLLESSQGLFFVLREGMLAWEVAGKQLFFYEEGDLLGFEGGLGLPQAALKSDFAVRLDAYEAEHLRRKMRSDPGLAETFEEYLLKYLALATLAWQSLLRFEGDLSPNIRVFEAGEVIVEQNSPADRVLNLVKGHAEVYVDGVKVGEILEDEIFGALAALTDTRRTATVKATGRAEVLSLARENFVHLIESRPRTVLKMVQDMARTIVALNRRVVELGYKKG